MMILNVSNLINEIIWNKIICNAYYVLKYLEVYEFFES